MKTRIALNFGLSALLFGGVVVGCTQGDHVATASSRDAGRAQSQAADLAAKAGKALAGKKGDKAVQYAEAAVALQPQDADYRALLGQSYLEAGRFASAHQAFADVLTLDPSNARAALNLALAQTAEGDWAGARDTLTTHANTIPASDRGLALALAGDPKGAVAVLMPAAREPGADAKTRQNLALTLALAGDWRDARVIVGMDLSPAQVDERLGQWASFAQPHSASDQVASLLGVRPSQDPGLPVALALNAPSAPVALAESTPVAVESPIAAPALADVAAAAEAPIAPATQTASVTFAPRHEVVQPVPAHAAPQLAVVARQSRAPAAVQTSAKPQPQELASGDYFVQLGAYENAAVAHDGWVRATRRFAGFAGQTPQGMSFSANGASVYRLSVGGFAKGDARRLCGQYQARGGRCFIRTGAGDQVAQWVRKGTELASR
ncbi:SPOR domain-containing protein [Sphingomonas koreensis]|nr:SPOR domain-containing protein [Sphingomonas koreensis]